MTKTYKYFFITILSASVQVVVHGNVNICISLNDTDSTVEGRYSLLVKTLKEEISEILENNSTMFLEELEFDFNHPAISIKGFIDNVTVTNLDQFEMAFFPEVNLTKNEVEIFNLTFRNLSIIGDYLMTGNIGDLFDIWGSGPFWVNVMNFSVSATTTLPSVNSTTACIFLDLDTKLQQVESWFSNMMDDQELEDLINGSIDDIAPEAVEVIWGEIKDSIDEPLQQWIDSIINGKSSRLTTNTLENTNQEVQDVQ